MDSNIEQDRTYLINAVSRQVGLSHKRIREYEKAGFLKPARAPRTNNRIYRRADIVRLQRVKELIHKFGFTLACLQYFLASAPCWIIFDCPDKEACLAYRSPHTPCYETMGASTDAGQHTKCSTCPIYLNRKVDRIALMSKP